MALLPPHYLDTVVALGTPKTEGSIQYTATGFFYGHHVGESDGNKEYRIFLVTNRHVIEGSNELSVRLNRPKGSDAKTYPITGPDGAKLWRTHPSAEYDIAVIPINAHTLEEDGIDYRFFRRDNTLSVEQANEIGILEGDGVFVLGFPLGLAGEERNYVITRQGCIARIKDWRAGTSRTILIDASVFPGNSGGPVVTRPNTSSIEGTKPNRVSYLIGMISSYIPYEYAAVDPRTGHPRVIFQENSGLAHVVPADVIHEIIESAI